MRERDRDLSESKTAAETLVDLLDYIEQVVRLDEKIAHRLADYRLQDGSTVAIRAAALSGLPGIATDLPDAEAVPAVPRPVLPVIVVVGTVGE